MNDREWALFEAEIEATFRGGLEEDRALALREHFGDVEFSTARAAIARLVLDEQVFVPTPGEMVGVLRRMFSAKWDFDCALRGMTSEQWTAHRRAERERKIEARRVALLAERNGDGPDGA